MCLLANAPSDSDCLKYANQAFSSDADPRIQQAQERFAARLNGKPADQDYRDLMLGLSSVYFPELSAQAACTLMSRWEYRLAPYLFASRNIFPHLDLLKESRARIKAPCLAIGGELDPIAPPVYMRRYPEVIPDCALSIIPGAGHFPFLTRPHEFLKQVSQWWEVKGKGKEV